MRISDSILIVNGNNSPILDQKLIDYFSKIDNKRIFFLHSIAKPKTFNNGETLVRIFANDDSFDFANCEKVFILESLTSNSSKSVNDVFFETELLMNAIKTRNQKIKIYLIATDFGYARQDRALNKKQEIDGKFYKTAEPETLKVRIKSLHSVGLSSLLLFDPHSNVLNENCEILNIELTTISHLNFLAFFGKIFFRMMNSDDENVKLFFEFFSCGGKNIDALSTVPEEIFLQIINFFNNELMLVAPDEGSALKVDKLAEAISDKLRIIFTGIDIVFPRYNLSQKLKSKIDITIIKKMRTEPGKSFVIDIEGNPTNRMCLIVDDILDTGGTLCNAAKALKNDHQAKSVHCFITHGVLSKDAVEKLNDSCIEKIHLTNSVTSVFAKIAREKKFEIHDLFDLIVGFIEKEI